MNELLVDLPDHPSCCDVCSLPDDDRDICAFDYYVDESGEWDPWLSRVPEAAYTDSLSMLGDVFIDTVETVRCQKLPFNRHQPIKIRAPLSLVHM